MAKKRKATKSEAAVEELPIGETNIQEEITVIPLDPVKEVIQESAPATREEVAPAPKKGTYDPVKSKEYRDRIKAAAIAGGHVFKVRGEGTGISIKKTSKSGKEYYYQPWSQLTEEQKKSRLDAARKRAAEDREYARKWKEEHPVQEVKA